MKLRFMHGVAAAAAVTLALSGCAQEAHPAPETPSGTFDVLGVLSLSGAASVQGGMMKAGAECAVDELNKNGGVLGRQVTLTVVDDKSDAAGSAQILRQNVDDSDKPDLVLAGVGSGWTIAMLPQLSRDGIFAGGPSVSAAVTDVSKLPYYFGVAHAPIDNMGAVIPFAEKAGAKKIGAFFSNDALGTDNLAQLTTALKGSGIELVSETFDPTQLDLTAPLQRLKDKGPDLLFISTYGAAAGTALKARTALGWNVPTVGDAAFTASNVPTLVGASDLKGVQILAVKEAAQLPSSAYPYPARWTALVSCVKSKVPNITGTFSLAAYGSQLVTVAAAAAELAKSTDPAKMTAALVKYDPKANPDLKHFWVDFSDPKYKADMHLPAAVDGDYVLLPACQMIDGQLPPSC